MIHIKPGLKLHKEVPHLALIACYLVIRKVGSIKCHLKFSRILVAIDTCKEPDISIPFIVCSRNAHFVVGLLVGQLRERLTVFPESPTDGPVWQVKVRTVTGYEFTLNFQLCGRVAIFKDLSGCGG